MKRIARNLFKSLFFKPDPTEKESECSSDQANRLPITPVPVSLPVRSKNTNIKEILDTYMGLLKTTDSCLPTNPSIDFAEENLVKILGVYSTVVTLPDGERIMIRPILPTDKLVMKDLIETGEVSQKSLSLRFYSVVTRVLDSSLDYLCAVNFDTHFAIAVLIEENGVWRGVATGRFIQDESCPDEAEWAALVIDSKHGHKIGSCILYYLSVVWERSDDDV